MFLSVRRWWGSGRGKVTARLFAFEFVVVLAGVFAAQALQAWVAERGALAQMEQARARVRRHVAEDLTYAAQWQAAIPCLDQRMVEVMRQLADGPLDARGIKRPKLTTFVPIQLGEQPELLLRARYGGDEADNIVEIAGGIDHAAIDVGSIVRNWGRLSLADAAFGRVAETDRGQARAAAADIRSALQGLAFGLADVGERSAAIGIKPVTAGASRPAVRCEEIWNAGALAIPR